VARSFPDQPAIVRRAIEFFRSSRFEYTLEPPYSDATRSTNSCSTPSRDSASTSHRASFFLMRAAGVPARVVTARDTQRWREVAGQGLHLIDTPGINELSGEERERLAYDVAAISEPGHLRRRR